MTAEKSRYLCRLGVKGADTIIKPTHPLVGAIRWDAWHGEQDSPGKAVQYSLSPTKYYWRLPFLPW